MSDGRVVILYAHIARQPIFDQDKRIVGYELLYRDGRAGNKASIADGDAATRGVLSDAITVFGIPQLTNRLPGYINFTRNLLINDFALLANPREIVIEVLGEMEIDSLLIRKLGELKKAGYTLALDDYNGGFKFDKAMQLFDIIRVDVSRYNNLQQKELIKKIGHGRIKLLAEKVETMEDFATARANGFVLFQGYFFEKPTLMRKEIPPLSASSYGRLLSELLRPDINFDICSEIIESDVVLTYMFMRQIQTVNYYRGTLISEIKHGMVMMGTEELRRWVSLVMLKQGNITHSDEMPRRAFLRGRFIERLIENANTRLDGRQGFLMGMFSLLDQIMGLRMESLLRDLRLAPEVEAAILGREENEYARFLQFAVIYEMENMRLVLPDIRLRLTEEEVATMYMSCIEETDLAFYRMGGSA